MTEPTDNISPLRAVQKPKVEELVRQDVCQLLEKLLALAKEGDIDTLFAVCSHADGTYSEACSKTQNFRAMVGQVEIVKQNWIMRYLASLQGRPIG